MPKLLYRRGMRILMVALVLAMMVVIYGFSMEDAEKSNETSGFVTRIALKLSHPEYDSLPAEQQQALFERAQHYVRKTAHFTEYAVLGFLLRLCIESNFGPFQDDKKAKKAAFCRKSLLFGLFSFLGGALYASLDELHQLLIDGRSGQITDVLLDSGGVMFGVCLCTLLLVLLLHRRRKTKAAERLPT